MKLETFFEKFDQFADAPDAVKKMRELVRHLAVTGALVDQDHNDESALALLDRIEDHKTALAREGKLRGPTTVAPMLPDEVTRMIPSSWVWVRLGEIVVNRDGERIPVSKDERATKAKTFDYYGASGIIDKIDGYLFNKPLLLVGEDGANLISRSTPIAFMARGQYWVNNHAHVLDGISEDFLRYIELHINAINLESYITGSAQPKMNQAKMNSIPIALPPLAEQKRIVAKVDELMALCDRLETQQQERETRHAALARASLARFSDAPTPANLNFLFHSSFSIHPSDLRKSILTLAVRGKLVPQDPDDEPAMELVARVADEKRRLVQAKEIKTETPLDSISDEETLFPIPNSWIWLRAGDLCRPISSGSTPDQSVFHPSEGIPYLKVYNIRNQAVDFDYKRQFIAVNHHKDRMKRSVLRPGDVIMNIVGPPLGKVAIVPDAFPEWNCNQAISFFRPIFPEFAPYLYTFLKEASFLQNIQLIGTAGQDNISVTKCKFIPIPIPPLAEQSRIVTKVKELMTFVDQLEMQIGASRNIAKNLLEALMVKLARLPAEPIAYHLKEIQTTNTYASSKTASEPENRD